MPRDDDRTEALPTSPIPDGPPAVGPRGDDPGVHGPGAVEPSVVGAPERKAAPRAKLKPTRISGTWVAVLASIVVLIVLLVFILQNLTDATIHFLGASGTLPLGVALLFAAIAGAILVALVGAARIMQLRRQAKRGLR
ncbi:lipopolysaccharide assembly protein LapA domain-containing protein [Saccharothrix sp. S26]|uniref:LapA family protein n=1 Tax=Saccharothrix sp. S26 TaxID=2907215 RepID=UPI001F207EB3|nr:lipopolysaccharide assembly protein LapA domain-containing protein [Saccharothrix sp. S26]MCE6996786.1 lipopolysaccharide assembly protein LapA domain-containing protein [Saccharothrix sp. S26]